VLVLREPQGQKLTDLSPEHLTDEVLMDAWRTSGRLHDARIAHGMLGAGNVVLVDDGHRNSSRVAFVDLARAAATRRPERFVADQVELLVTSAPLVGEARALVAAEQTLGRDGLGDILSFIEAPALSSRARHGLTNEKQLLKALRERGAALAGVEVPQPVALR